MSAELERDDELARDPALARALEALPPAPADPAFRARLRVAFLQGPEAQEPGPAAPRPRPQLALLPLVALLAAAAIVLVFFLSSPPAGAGWEVLASSRGASILVDDRPYAVSPPEELQLALARGGRVRTGEGTLLRLRLGERLALEIGPQSEVTLPHPDPVTEVPAPVLAALQGHLAVATGPAFRGSSLLVRAPEIEVEVVGTRFAVDVGPQGTCACCTEGVIEVRSLALPEQSGQVAAGGMAVAMPDGSLKFAPETDPSHVAGLAELAAEF